MSCASTMWLLRSMFFCWLVILVDVDVLVLASPLCIVLLESNLNFVDWCATLRHSFGLKLWSLENMKTALLWPSYHLKFYWIVYKIIMHSPRITLSLPFYLTHTNPLAHAQTHCTCKWIKKMINFSFRRSYRLG